MKRILVIEDEPQMRLGLRDNLELEGYEVQTAADGEEGLAKAAGVLARPGHPRRDAAARRTGSTCAANCARAHRTARRS